MHGKETQGEREKGKKERREQNKKKVQENRKMRSIKGKGETEGGRVKT